MSSMSLWNSRHVDERTLPLTFCLLPKAFAQKLTPAVCTELMIPFWRRRSSSWRVSNRHLWRRLLGLFAHLQQGQEAVTAGHLWSLGMRQTSSSPCWISNSSLHCSSNLPRSVQYPFARLANEDLLHCLLCNQLWLLYQRSTPPQSRLVHGE